MSIRTTAIDSRPAEESAPRISWRSWAGINAANFFLAEVTGVTLPFVTTYLQAQHWAPLPIGVATAAAGLGVFVMQTPAGVITDRLSQRRLLLAVASLILGVCYGLLPWLPAKHATIDSLLFLSGAAQAFFLPALGALALALAGHGGLNRMMGVNQGFNHAGNLAAAVVAIGLVSYGGPAAVFLAVLGISLLAAWSLFWIRAGELNQPLTEGQPSTEGQPNAAGADKTSFRALLQDPRIRTLLAATALFHLANAPVMPLVAQDVKALGGSDAQVAWVVLVAQAVMIPVSLLAGWQVDCWGRKPVFAIGFVVLPVRIALYAFAATPAHLIAIQALDGVGAGIYGVAVVAMTADLTRRRGGFNTLSGLIATALSIGGVAGPLMTGALTQYLGYRVAFAVFALIAAAATALFLAKMPETAAAAD